MAKITLEKTDTIIRVSGPSSFLPLNAAVGSSNSQFKIVLDTATARADLSKIGTAADNTTLVFFGKSTDYQVIYNAKTGIANVVDSAMKIVASLPIPKLAANNIRLNFDDYADTTYVTLSKPVGTSKALVLSSQPDLAPTVTLSSIAATVNEGSTVTYTATLDKAALTDLNIPYTVTGSTGFTTADITVSTLNTIKIVAGSKTGTLVLTAVPDAKTEGAETVSVTLGATAGVLAGATTTVTTTITDSTPIKISATATTGTATTAFDEFTIAAGNYSANIIGFGTGDTLLFDANTVRSVTNISVADGNLTVTGSLNNQLVTLNLTGINPALDTQIIDIASFVSVFAPVGPATTTAISSTTTTGTASGGVDTFNIASGNYIASIAGFGVKDKLVFTPGSVEAITNTSVTDGNITVTGSFNNQFVTIQLTGVSTALDSGVFDVQSFNTVFGIGSLV